MSPWLHRPVSGAEVAMVAEPGARAAGDAYAPITDRTSAP
jgi:hypothetical protein